MAKDFSVINRGVPLKDAYEKVTGRLQFPPDFIIPGMLYGRVLRSPHAHARIKRIDTSKAEALPGVVTVLTYKDVPEREWFGLWLNYRGRVMDDKARFVGDEVAAVAAVDERTAEEALALIEVDYEVLPHVFDPVESMKPDAPQVRSDGNVRTPVVVEWGDTEKGFEEADVLVENKTQNRIQDQATMGLNAPTASWTDGKVTLWTGTTCPSELRDAIANLLEMPKSKVRVMALNTGPSLGKWWFNNIDMVVVLLAKKARKAVKLIVTQEEVFSGIKRRHAELSEGKLGFKKDGTIVSVYLKDIFENGAYGDKCDVYQSIPDLWTRIHNAKFEMYGTATNLVTSGCMRGVGDLTMNFAMEQLINKAAEKLQMDPVEIRLKNAVRTGDPLRTQRSLHQLLAPDVPMPSSFTISSAALDKCLRKGAEAIGWREKWKGWGKPTEVHGAKRRGVGVATGMHICGIRYAGQCGAIVKINSDGSVNLLVSLGRQGTGNDTTQCQIAAEELGVAYDMVSITCGDTEVTPWGQGSTASTSTHLSGTATKAAAADAKRQLLELAAKEFEARPEELDIQEGMIYHKDGPQRKIPMTDITAKQLPDLWDVSRQPCIVGSAITNVPADSVAKHMAAHFVELEVDIDTGKVEILRYVQAQDSGRLINPPVCENQLSGGYFQGTGFSLIEELVHDENGKILNPDYANYKIWRCGDLPDPELIFIEEIDPASPFGAKGLGEVPVCLPPGTIAMAIYNATGAWMNETPMTPERILRTLGKI
jgi:xanthine dehydrogenase molybdenum-binding subunit